MEKILGFVTLGGALIALLFAFIMAKKVLKFPEGTDLMKQIAGYIKTGANAYLK